MEDCLKLSSLFGGVELKRDELISLNLQQPERKAMTFTPISQTGSFANVLLPRTRFDYAKEVGDGLGSSVLMSPVKWVQRNFNDAPLQVFDNSGDEPEPVRFHPLIDLIKRPNPYYTGAALWAGTLYSFIVDGNGYWLKIRRSRRNIPWNENVSSEIEQLIYAQHWLIEPQYTAMDSALISHYRYSPGGPVIDIDPKNVIHFRNGINPRDQRKGMSMIYSELREIFTDDEAANFCATLLKNMGVPGLVISPSSTGGATAILEDADETKRMLRATLSGEKRGDPFVSTIPINVEQLKVDQGGMDFSTVRNTPEERICAAIGIPAPVCGFGAGLDTTKVGATMQEFKRMAWENGIIPMHKPMDEQIEIDLLPEVDAKALRRTVGRNYKVVAALQENLTDKVKRLDIMVKGGWMQVATAQQEAGYEPDATQAVYLRSITTNPVPANEIPPKPQPQQALPAKPKELKSASSAEQDFQDELDRQEAQGASVIAGQFNDEARGVLHAIGKR